MHLAHDPWLVALAVALAAVGICLIRAAVPTQFRQRRERPSHPTRKKTLAHAFAIVMVMVIGITGLSNSAAQAAPAASAPPSANHTSGGNNSGGSSFLDGLKAGVDNVVKGAATAINKVTNVVHNLTPTLPTNKKTDQQSKSNSAAVIKAVNEASKQPKSTTTNPPPPKNQNGDTNSGYNIGLDTLNKHFTANANAWNNTHTNQPAATGNTHNSQSPPTRTKNSDINTGNTNKNTTGYATTGIVNSHFNSPAKNKNSGNTDYNTGLDTFTKNVTNTSQTWTNHTNQPPARKRTGSTNTAGGYNYNTGLDTFTKNVAADNWPGKNVKTGSVNGGVTWSTVDDKSVRDKTNKPGFPGGSGPGSIGLPGLPFITVSNGDPVSVDGQQPSWDFPHGPQVITTNSDTGFGGRKPNLIPWTGDPTNLVDLATPAHQSEPDKPGTPPIVVTWPVGDTHTTGTSTPLAGTGRQHTGERPSTHPITTSATGTDRGTTTGRVTSTGTSVEGTPPAGTYRGSIPKHTTPQAQDSTYLQPAPTFHTAGQQPGKSEDKSEKNSTKEVTNQCDALGDLLTSAAANGLTAWGMQQLDAWMTKAAAQTGVDPRDNPVYQASQSAGDLAQGAQLYDELAHGGDGSECGDTTSSPSSKDLSKADKATQDAATATTGGGRGHGHGAPPVASGSPFEQPDGSWHDGMLHLNPAENHAVDDFLSTAETNEPVITVKMQQIADRAGLKVHMDGFDFTKVNLEGIGSRLKESDSLKRKVAGELKKAQDAHQPRNVEKVLGDIGDSIRYTFSMPDDSYFAKTSEIYYRLQKAGFTPDSQTNYWPNPEGYMGINSRWTYRGDSTSPVAQPPQKIEVQFHTLFSYFTKGPLTHDDYAIKRNLNKSQAERDAAQNRINKLFAEVNHPSMVEMLTPDYIQKLIDLYRKHHPPSTP